MNGREERTQPRWCAHLLELPSNPRWILYNPEGGLSYPVEEGAGKGCSPLVLPAVDIGHGSRELCCKAR